MDVLLPHMPEHIRIILVERELRLHLQRYLGEVEVIFLSFVVHHAKQRTVQGHEEDLRSAAADIKHAVLQLLSCLPAGKAV